MVPSGFRRVVTISAAIYYPMAVLLGWAIVVNANARSLAMERAVNLQTIGSKASYAGNTVLETISFGWYDAASRTDADYEESLALAAARQAARLAHGHPARAGARGLIRRRCSSGSG